MSNYPEDENLSQKEIILLKHKSEEKQLQAKIQQLKKTINKDKKRKKEVLEEISALEKELHDRHQMELNQLDNQAEEMFKASHHGGLSNGIRSIQIDDKQQDDGDSDMQNGKKVSKAQKRRQKKSEISKEREALIKEAEEKNKYSARNIEADKLKNILKEKKLIMYEINPDGNCMYAAIAHQLGCGVTVQNLRLKAGSFIRDHAEDFAPFITDSATGKVVTPAQFNHYCHQLENTCAWGGQPELRALSQVLQKRIEVLQADAPPIVFGEEFSSANCVILAYYRHYYGLGEHYNSVVAMRTPENC